MKKEVSAKLDQLAIGDLSITGVVRRSRVDTNVIEFQFTNAQGTVESGILPVHGDLISEVANTGRQIWHQGVMQHEVTVTFNADAQIPVNVVLRFIRGLLDLVAQTTSPVLGLPVVDASTKAEASRIAPRCSYAGCGSGDSWPRA